MARKAKKIAKAAKCSVLIREFKRAYGAGKDADWKPSARKLKKFGDDLARSCVNKRGG